MSKTNSIKSLLLEAWRMRWNEVQWGINIKKVLPRGVSGDVYDLADCILQQGLVGPTPNLIFIGYLKHCISAQLVSFGAVLSAIAKYQDFGKTHCILCLLDLAISFKQRLGCLGSEEECISLCKSVVALSGWLYSCIFHSLSKLFEAKIGSSNQNQSQFTNHGGPHAHHGTSNNPSSGQQIGSFGNPSNEQVQIIEKSAEMLNYIGNSAFLKSLFYVGKAEDPSLYLIFTHKFKEVENKLTNGGVLSSNSAISSLTFETCLHFLEKLEWNNIDPSEVAAKQLLETNSSNHLAYSSTSVLCSLNAVIAFDAVLNPVSDCETFAEQILIISKFSDMSKSDMFCEIIRACFIGLVDSVGSSGEDLKWAAFTFLKLPQILSKLNSLSKNEAKGNGCPDLEMGLEKLLTYTPLLDLTDAKSNSDCLHLFLTELCKANLLTSERMAEIIAKRQSETSTRTMLSRSDQCQPGQAGATLILRAEPTVTSILKTLDSDYSKNQDALLGVLCHMVPGKSFELILNAAAATGKLRSFITKLLKFNEFNKEIQNEKFAASQTRAQLFDITFLMLCHIAQNYGIEIITSNCETKNSFFATWCTTSLPEAGHYKCPDHVLANCDSNKIDILLKHFTSTDTEFKTHLVKWHEVCQNGPAAIKEVLVAWEHDAISTDYVKQILDNVKSRMCCLPVVISAWICSYINNIHHDERLKPMNMLHQFMTPLPPEATTPGSGDANVGSQAINPATSDFYKERSTLMATIIKKMMYDLHPLFQQTKPKGVPVIYHGLTVKTSFWDLIESNFASAHSKCWLDLKTVHNMETLLCVGGSNCFTDSLIRQLLKFEHTHDLNKAVNLIFGLFHMDIEQNALTLINHVVTNYLLNETKQELLYEPKISSLARLTVMTIFAALKEVENKNINSQRLGKKRYFHQDTLSDYEPMDVDSNVQMNSNSNTQRPTKMRRTDPVHGFMNILEDTPFYLNFQQLSSDEQLKISNSVLQEPLNKAISNLFRLLAAIISDPNISQRTLFPLVFLEQLIFCLKKDAQKILKFMPLHMAMCLIKTMPEALTFEFFLSITNIQTLKARKIVSKGLCQLQRAKRSHFI